LTLIQFNFELTTIALQLCSPQCRAQPAEDAGEATSKSRQLPKLPSCCYDGLVTAEEGGAEEENKESKE
jgi:hypothetical protein